MIYICGDSFCVSDAAYLEIIPWHEQLPKHKNLARKCASNYLISQQIEQAINECASYIIVTFTSSLRSELHYNGELIPFSWLSLDSTTPFDQEQLNLLKQQYLHIDLDTEIRKNRLIIEASLQRLVDSKISFIFDQGGFEHPSYGGVGKYFIKFEQYRSQYNLWDYSTTRSHRPYFHIQDQQIHNKIAEYYNEQIIKA